MDARIPKKSTLTFFLLSVLTLGIYAIVFWHKLGKNVNILCEGDGKRTMKYGFAFFLSVITFGIYGIIWKVKLAERLKVNAERYELMIPEGGTEVALFSTLGIILVGAGIPISSFIIIKNYNMIAEAYNAYNELPEPEEEFIDLFSKDEILNLDGSENDEETSEQEEIAE